MAESFLRRAYNKLDEARDHLSKFNYPESISASQECIELSIKSIFLLLQKQYPKTHEFSDDEFAKLLERIPKGVEWRNFPRLFLISKFWSSFYTVAKYGYEKFAVGPEKLFKDDEAKLAIKHADDCYYAADHLRQEACRGAI